MKYFLLTLVGALVSGAGTLAQAGGDTEHFFPSGKERPLYLSETPVGVASTPEFLSKVAAAVGVQPATVGAPSQTDLPAVPVVMEPGSPIVELDPVSVATDEIGAQLEEGLSQARVQRLPIAVMPFVERPSRGRDNALGERVSESFIYQLQSREFNLVDYRAVSMNTTVKPELNAKMISGLRNRYRIYFVLTGTYARYNGGIVINARVLDTTTRQVVASGQSHITDAQLEGDLPGYDPLTAMRKGMIIENGEGPKGL